MGKNAIIIGSFLLILGLANSAGAQLTVIGIAEYDSNGDGVAESYKLIHDDDGPFGPVTWLDYSRPNTNTPDWVGDWQTHKSWADGLGTELTVHLLPRITSTIDWSTDWRLPLGIDGTDVLGYDGTKPRGFNVTSSELGHLFYQGFGNLGQYDTSGNLSVDGTWGLLNTFVLTNLAEAGYWSATEYGVESPTDAWLFSLADGKQDFTDKNSLFRAIAVHPGEVAVPPIVVTPAPFGPDSANITNIYFPMQVGDLRKYEGTDSLDGYGRYWKVETTEIVSGVNCVKVLVRGDGNDPDPDLDPNWHYGWFAQDQDQNVWLLQLYSGIDDSLSTMWPGQPILWMPGFPAIGQQVMDFGDDVIPQVLDAGLTFSFSEPNRAPISGVIKIANDYFAPHIGQISELFSNDLAAEWVLRPPPADSDGDQDIDGLDLLQFKQNLAANKFGADLDLNGVWDTEDVKLFSAVFGSSASDMFSHYNADGTTLFKLNLADLGKAARTLLDHSGPITEDLLNYLVFLSIGNQSELSPVFAPRGIAGDFIVEVVDGSVDFSDYILPGDLNGDGDVSDADLQILTAAIVSGSFNQAMDANRDGNLNEVDLIYVAARLTTEAASFHFYSESGASLPLSPVLWSAGTFQVDVSNLNPVPTAVRVIVRDRNGASAVKEGLDDLDQEWHRVLSASPSGSKRTPSSLVRTPAETATEPNSEVEQFLMSLFVLDSAPSTDYFLTSWFLHVKMKAEYIYEGRTLFEQNLIPYEPIATPSLEIIRDTAFSYSMGVGCTPKLESAYWEFECSSPVGGLSVLKSKTKTKNDSFTVGENTVILKKPISWVRDTKYDTPSHTLRGWVGNTLVEGGDDWMCGDMRFTRLGPGDGEFVTIVDVWDLRFEVLEKLPMGDYLVEFSSDEETIYTLDEDFVFTNTDQIPKFITEAPYIPQACITGDWKVYVFGNSFDMGCTIDGTLGSESGGVCSLNGNSFNMSKYDGDGTWSFTGTMDWDNKTILGSWKLDNTPPDCTGCWFEAYFTPRN